jgi:hypothetical protein
MALHDQLPIHRSGVQLLALAYKVQEQMPRGVKRGLGDKITQHCIEMLDRMALANASQRHARAAHIEQLLTHQRALTVLMRVCFDARYTSHRLWGESVQLLDSIGRQSCATAAHRARRSAPLVRAPRGRAARLHQQRVRDAAPSQPQPSPARSPCQPCPAPWPKRQRRCHQSHHSNRRPSCLIASSP